MSCPLRRIFLKPREKHPETDINIISYLLFGYIPRFSSTESTLPTQQQRIDVMQPVRLEMAIITVEIRIRKDLSSRGPRNADLLIDVGELVRVFHETDKLSVGPFPVIRVHGTHVYIVDNHREANFIEHQVLLATTYDSIISGEHLMTTVHSSLPQSSSNLPCKSFTVNCKIIPSVLITEVLHHNDPRMRSDQADRAWKQEIEILIRRGIWEHVPEEDVPPGSNIISGSLVIAIKNVEKNKPIFKARFVVHGIVMRKNAISFTIQPMSTKLCTTDRTCCY